jgi:alpha-tubulin suppressor-like RCC1 family protein
MRDMLGSNEDGQCSVPAGLKDVVAISAGTFHVTALLREGQLVCWGDNGSGQCSVPANLLITVSEVEGCDTEFYQLK